MANEIRLKKDVFNSEKYNKVIDRSFNEFVDPTPEQDTDTVEELFRLYEKLFFTIPINGDINSHEYILKRSSEIADFEKTTEDIQPLLDEIADLRRNLLESNEEIIQLQNQLARE